MSSSIRNRPDADLIVRKSLRRGGRAPGETVRGTAPIAGSLGAQAVIRGFQVVLAQSAAALTSEAGSERPVFTRVNHCQ